MRTFIVVSGVLDDGTAAKKARKLCGDQKSVNKAGYEVVRTAFEGPLGASKGLGGGMELGLPMTLTILVLTAGMFAFANWRGRQPAQPLKVRMVNYHVVQIICVVVVLLMVAHLVTLLSGQPLAPRGGGGRF